jgi:hypothetical protein
MNEKHLQELLVATCNLGMWDVILDELAVIIGELKRQGLTSSNG